MIRATGGNHGDAAAPRDYSATAKDVAALYGLSIHMVYKLCDTAGLPHRRLGSVRRFNLEEVDEWTRCASETFAEAERAKREARKGPAKAPAKPPAKAPRKVTKPAKPRRKAPRGVRRAA